MDWEPDFADFCEFIKSSLKHMCLIWSNIGICGKQSQNRLHTFFTHLKTLAKDMEEEERGREEALLANIESNSEELLKLCQELSLPPYEATEGLTILQLEKNLRLKLEELEKEKTKRLDLLKKLKEQLHDYTTRLNTDTYSIPVSPGRIPTSEQLEGLQQHVDVLKAEKDRRVKIIKNHKEKIKELFHSLDLKPATLFEKNILSDDDVSLLSTDNINAMKKLQEELFLKLKHNEETAIELREKLSLLWDRLQIDQSERELFLRTYPGHHPKTLDALKAELSRCELLKLENIKLFVDKLREELQEWWDKCFIGQEQREKFRAYHDDSYSEDLLELHDLELQKLKTYYEENKAIFAAVEKREQMWCKMLELEKRADDPNRFVNRGGALIQEEKERKEVNEKLPELEKKLEKMIAEWENRQGQVFLINDIGYMDYIALQKEKHEEEKENRILERKKAKAKLLEDEALKGCQLTTPGKRKLIGTPFKTPNKINKTNTPLTVSRIHSSLAMYQSPLGRSRSAKQQGTRKRGLRGKGPCTPKTPVLNELNNKNSMFSTSTVSGKGILNTTVSLASIAGSYTEFSKELHKKSQKDTCRSSTLTPKNTPKKKATLKTRGRLPFLI